MRTKNERDVSKSHENKKNSSERTGQASDRVRSAKHAMQDVK